MGGARVRLVPAVPVNDPPQDQAGTEPRDESEPPVPRHRVLSNNPYAAADGAA